jgi:uncharacterized membrane protein
MSRAWLLLPITAAALGLPWAARGQAPPETFEVVARIPGTIAVNINANGDVVGFIWEEEAERPGVVAQVPFLLRGGQMTRLPLLEGYTSTFPAAVSDGGLVVGRVSKPVIPGVRVEMQNQAFVWDASGGIRGLGVLEGGVSSFASAVSADGRRIGGFILGEDRIRPCVWDLAADGKSWEGATLPIEQTLGSNVLALSDDGRFASAVDGTLPCLWTADGAGGWNREVIGGPASLMPRDVNNSGMVVGLRFDGDGMPRAAAWDRDGGLRQLQEPEGYVKSEATSVNNAGVVVGMVDGPGGSDIYPRGFIFSGGQLTLIEEGSPVFASAAAINDRGQVAGIIEEEEPGAEPPGPRDPR